MVWVVARGSVRQLCDPRPAPRGLGDTPAAAAELTDAPSAAADLNTPEEPHFVDFDFDFPLPPSLTRIPHHGKAEEKCV
jgi:hypothetical protein